MPSSQEHNQAHQYLECHLCVSDPPSADSHNHVLVICHSWITHGTCALQNCECICIAVVPCKGEDVWLCCCCQGTMEGLHAIVGGSSSGKGQLSRLYHQRPAKSSGPVHHQWMQHLQGRLRLTATCQEHAAALPRSCRSGHTIFSMSSWCKHHPCY